jgi:lipopolysaccharide export LptBFGC system permease protein LptF
MSTETLNVFLRGALWACSWVAALFFLRFWRVGRDRLFVFFAAAFFLIGLNFVGLVAVSGISEDRHYVYALRLVAFILILIGIFDKNRRAKPAAP